MLIGLVKWFDSEKGFGVTDIPNGDEFFLHINSFKIKPDKISAGTSIIFSKKFDSKKGRYNAVNSRMLGEPEDWKLIFSFLGKKSTVDFEFEKKERFRGKQYHSKSTQSINIIKTSVIQFLNEKEVEEAIAIIIDYFDNELDDEYFVSYCEHVEYSVKRIYPDNISTSTLNKVFAHFKANLNEQILFQVWKQLKFKYIAYSENGDYEIPVNVLYSNISKINKADLIRISNYSYGSEFCADFFNIRFSNVDELSFSEIKELYSLIELENEIKREERILQLDESYFNLVKSKVIGKTDSYGIINNENDFDKYNKLFLDIPTDLNEKRTFELKDTIINIIISKCSANYKPELWLKGYIDELPFEIVSEYFNQSSHLLQKQISILSRLQSEQQSKLLNEKFNNLNILSSIEIEELYQLLQYENEDNREKRKFQIDELFVNQLRSELIEKANNLGIIENDIDFENYNKLFLGIPDELDENKSNEIKESIHTIIISKCAKIYRVRLWIKGVMPELSFDEISDNFLNSETPDSTRISILCKLETKSQFELLKKYSDFSNYEQSFNLIEGLVKKRNTFSHYFNLSSFLFDNKYWEDKKDGELVRLFTEYVETKTSDKEKYDLFFKGYIRHVPQNLVFQNIDKLGKEECNLIIESIPEDKSFIKKILEQKISIEDTDALNWLYVLANDFLDVEGFNSYDNKVFETINQTEYFNLWEKGKAKILPISQIDDLLNETYENYLILDQWINKKLITKDEIEELLFKYLEKQLDVTDRIIFYKQLNHIKYLLILNEYIVQKIKQLNNDFYNIILWYLDKNEALNFELLKHKFIYFSPDDQIRIIRKLFYLKAIEKFDLTVEKLDELTRFDLDLYNTNLKFNPEVPIDISTDVVIKALISFKNNNRFVVESELLSIVLKDLMNTQTRRFKMSDYFENCLGREIAQFNWRRNGEIVKVKFGDNQFCFAITFEYDADLVEAVKSIPGRKWNTEYKVWSVPSKYEKEVLKFAEKYRFYLDFDGSNYANNVHLAEFVRKQVPNGIIFCEGRLANQQHKMFKRKFWWCEGQPCFSNCETIHSVDEWEKYTLLDFCEILGFNTDEINGMGDSILRGQYYQFISLVNRFNRLLEKIYCKDCNHILFPSDFGISNFAAHNVVRFQCRNENCSNNEVIYLNHCLNGQCNNIIDSRVSRRCTNGLFICDVCGSCCSHEMLKRYLSSLELNGGYIHESLKICVDKKLGHLERGEYFCHSCGSKMDESIHDVFTCSKCKVKYDTTKYMFKRPHKQLKIM